LKGRKVLLDASVSQSVELIKASARDRGLLIEDEASQGARSRVSLGFKMEAPPDHVIFVAVRVASKGAQRSTAILTEPNIDGDNSAMLLLGLIITGGFAFLGLMFGLYVLVAPTFLLLALAGRAGGSSVDGVMVHLVAGAIAEAAQAARGG